MEKKQKILIVDDEPRNQRILCETLEDLFELSVASSGEEALKLVEEFGPDLVLLDIMMPGIDGYEVCKKIRDNPKQTLTKVILVSGKAMVNERLKGYEAGADDYMTKPFESEELLAKAKVFLRLNHVEKNLKDMNQSLDQKVQERTQQLLDAEAKMITTAKMSALGEMAGGIAHEINTPLGTIGMIAEQVQEMIGAETIDRKTVMEMTQILSETVGKIATIIKGLRTFSRDGSQDAFEPASLKKIIGDTLALCNEKLKNANVKIEIALEAEDFSIECRAVQISQVLLNLVSNACDAVQTLPEKWVKISASVKEEQLEVAVTDSGSGISEALRNKLFQPFFTTKEVGKGTGLGLSISKGIMTAHHGELRIDDKRKHTCFILSFPEKYFSQFDSTFRRAV